ncbi:MAG: hypothetical protein JWL84_2243 [Rhodospirillales bacterium]|jgi:hypothetical protein|nr:hypothetical protein [Rhodospirillales bacterium]
MEGNGEAAPALIRCHERAGHVVRPFRPYGRTRIRFRLSSAAVSEVDEFMGSPNP